MTSNDITNKSEPSYHIYLLKIGDILMKGVNYREIRGMPYVRREYIRGKPQNKIARFASGPAKK